MADAQDGEVNKKVPYADAMLPGATGAPGAELAALITPPELMEGAGWAHAPVRLAIRHAQPAPNIAFTADMCPKRIIWRRAEGRPGPQIPIINSPPPTLTNFSLQPGFLTRVFFARGFGKEPTTMLIQEKQHQANCENAQKSTGPKTPEGKEPVRFNPQAGASARAK